MVSSTSISTDTVSIEYEVLCNRVAPFLNNKIPDGMLYDMVRDAVIQVCRDLDFLRTDYEFDVDGTTNEFTLRHQGYSFSNPIRAWQDMKDTCHLLPSRVFDNIMINVNQTKLSVPQDIIDCIRDKIIFLVSVTPNRNSTTFPATVYDQEAGLLIMRSRMLMREFDPAPLPEAMYREKVGRAYSRYMSTLGEETVNMFI